jgi:hypothetical protein
VFRKLNSFPIAIAIHFVVIAGAGPKRSLLERNKVHDEGLVGETPDHLLHTISRKVNDRNSGKEAIAR